MSLVGFARNHNLNNNGILLERLIWGRGGKRAD